MIKSILLLLSLFGFVASAQPADEAPAASGDHSMEQPTATRIAAKKKSSKKKSSKKKKKKKNP
jgi:hypothetical protein